MPNNQVVLQVLKDLKKVIVTPEELFTKRYAQVYMCNGLAQLHQQYATAEAKAACAVVQKEIMAYLSPHFVNNFTSLPQARNGAADFKQMQTNAQRLRHEWLDRAIKELS